MQDNIVDRIIESDSFGKSLIYSNLLKYLVDCTESNEVPKESTIGTQIFRLNSAENYDSAKVRVYIYNLRKKLVKYFANEGIDESYILTIPKGSYKVEIVERPKLSNFKKNETRKTQFFYIVGGILLISLILNGAFLLNKDSNQSEYQDLAKSKFWSNIIQNERPILIVLGDLLIFNERDTVSGLNRTIRIPAVNSLSEYEAYLDSLNDTSKEYEVMTYTYLIKNSATWIESLTKLFFANDRDFQIRVISRVDVKDLHDHNIIFIGMQKTAGILNNYFSSSKFDYTENDKYAYPSESGEMKTYRSDGNPDEFHTDFGFVARYTGPNNNIIFMFGGLGDASTSQSLKNFTNTTSVQKLESQMQDAFGKIPDNFEILFEVSGADRTELDTKVLYMNKLDK